MKKLIVFDLDNTLTDSKTPIGLDQALLIRELLKKTNVAVISGASFEQFKKQFINPLGAETSVLPRLFIIPTSGAELCIFEGEWKKLYSEKLSVDEKKRIRTAFSDVLGVTKSDLNLRLDDRQTGMTYSALGIDAPPETKKVWDPDQNKRKEMRLKLIPYLKGLEVSIGGTTSLDINKQDINKSFGVKKLMDYLKLRTTDVVFIGDALFPGGNDSAVLKLGVEVIITSGPEQTKNIIKKILSQV